MKLTYASPEVQVDYLYIEKNLLESDKNSQTEIGSLDNPENANPWTIK